MRQKLLIILIAGLFIIQLVLLAILGFSLQNIQQRLLQAALAPTDTATHTPTFTPTDTPPPTASPIPPTETPLPPTATPAPTQTPLILVVTATPTLTPLPTPTPRRAPMSRSMPATATPTLTPLLEASQLQTPPDGETFGFPNTPHLRWQGIKSPLAEDELYLVTIKFKHFGEIWTDYAWSTSPHWHVGEHEYLLTLSDDGRFEWSVQLIRQTSTNNDGVPQGPALSQHSQTRVFYWRIHVPDSITESSPIR